LIEERFREPLSIDALARHAHLSPSRLSHLFLEQMGTTPMAFLESRRIREAIRLLLSTDLLIREVAEAAGYANAFHFCVRFKKYTHSAPRDFRRLGSPRRRSGGTAQ
jgi:AraC-like DNA-binding protein